MYNVYATFYVRQLGLVDNECLEIGHGGEGSVTQHHQRVPGEHETLEVRETSEHRREYGADLVVTDVESAQVRQSVERAGLKHGSIEATT